MTADPLWYKDAIIYQLHVKTFADSNGDGTGDFRGLTTRLDYIRDLGVDCIWILPMYPSPFRDDGYDIADYGSIHPSYGTLDDFREFLSAAHERGLKVITELVLNHTSDQHQWFKEARQSRASPRRDWYVWSDRDDRYAGVRIIFSDTERSNWAWDPDSQQVLLAPVLQPSAGLELRQSGRPRRDVEGHAVLARPRRRRIPRGRGAVPDRARGHFMREPAGDA